MRDKCLECRYALWDYEPFPDRGDIQWFIYGCNAENEDECLDESFSQEEAVNAD